MQLTEQDILDATERFRTLSDHAKDQLDPLVKAIAQMNNVFQPAERQGVRACPNRVIALLCTDLYEQWNRIMLERE